MILFLSLFSIAFLFLAVAFMVLISRIALRYFRLLSSFVEDSRVEEFFLKAAILGEIHSFEKDLPAGTRLLSAYEKSMSIVTDVLLQNGYNPKQYNLKALVLLARVRLGLDQIPKAGE